ncbi:uncharacterized protein LOC115626338 [Scaptodrosophila lebanonensis]|uniref:Uncharacterized protein LOC115626338 n=1 Tax=Drosophila lebanonensis TaxID=7225 RepID=A0A6J2TR00_DROLE|nr:uncharacterized protein LOC115626338 [Scaptodrosophila lebanonensis]XP_030377544.1 uncharacterized protein LOC115626338 [Scaptodrosophila lebanonensis]
MSYLLTEIALEMLGYKFYDTNGTFHLTNFQQSTPSSSNDKDLDEPPLSEFIDQPASTTIQNGDASNDQEVPTTSSSHNDSQAAKPAENLESKVRRTPAKALAKIKSYESDKIKVQIKARVQKSIDEQKTKPNEQELQKFLDDEKMKVMEDAATMRHFREYLEDRLQRMDSRLFEKYQRTFRKD